MAASRAINRPALLSLGLHVTFLLAALLVTGRHRSPATAPVTHTIDLSFDPLPESPSPVTAPAPEHPAVGAIAHVRPPGIASIAPIHPRSAPPTGPAAQAPVATLPTLSVPVVPSPNVISHPVDALEILRTARTDTDRILATGEVHIAASAVFRSDRDIVPHEHGTELERATENSAGYIRAMLADTHHHEAPGVRNYYWYLRRRMEEHWAPGITRVPTLVDALLSGVVMSQRAMDAVLDSAHGQFQTPGRMGSAADALDNAHGPWGSPQVAMRGIVDASRGNVHTTRAEVEVDQDADGSVRTVRILHSSRIPSYDAAALDAVRAALPMQTPVAMPGGRRSRWSFQVAASRDPILPGLGMEFDESTGWFEVHYPGRVHLRSRVWLEHAAPLGS